MLTRKNSQRKQRVQRTLSCELLEDRRLLAVVTSAADSGPGTLREAIAGMDLTITFDVATMGTSTIELTSGALVVGRDVLIDGDDGMGGRVTINGGGLNSVLHVYNYLYVASPTLSNLIITGGQAPNGGGIANEEDLTLSNVAVTGNTAAMSGGGISNAGTLTLQDSTIGNNTANQGGGIFNDANSELMLNGAIVSGNTASGYGGGITDYGTSFVQNSTIESNQASAGGGLFVNSCEPVKHQNNTFENNQAKFSVGQPQSGKGGGIAVHGGTFELVQNTVSGNWADFSGGGIRGLNANANCNTELDIRYSTIAYNDVGGFNGTGGGIRVEGVSILDLESTIVAKNDAPNFREDISVTSSNVNANFSLIGNRFGSGIPSGGTNKTGNRNIFGGTRLDPDLAPLGNYGGPTKTHALNQNSPARDMGGPGNNHPTGFDQRGPTFGRILNLQMDMGAFEVAPTATSTTTATTTLRI